MAIKQERFEAGHQSLWTRIEQALAAGPAADGAAEFPALYRQLCQSLALARQRGYSPALTGYLEKLVLDGHRRLYGTQSERPMSLVRLLTTTFPQRVRAEWRLLALALLAFAGVALVSGLLVWFRPQWAYAFMSAGELAQYSDMYSPGARQLGRASSEDDVMMFGFYIWNNVSIGFRTFAAGIFAGAPSLLSLGNNGLHFGIVAAWLSMDAGTAERFWSFVITHASFEITGLLLSAVAGMRLGLALLRPGRLRRRQALAVAAGQAFPVMAGAALLTVLAAFFEGFWSASASISPAVKYAVGAGCWLAVIAYLTLAGRRTSDAA